MVPHSIQRADGKLKLNATHILPVEPMIFIELILETGEELLTDLITQTGEELLTGSRVTQKQPLKSFTHSYMDETPLFS